jgi:hypothetical protein
MNEPSSHLRKGLACVAGLVLGAIGAAALLMLWSAPAWTAVLAMLIGGVLGLVFGERGVLAVIRVLGWM